MTKQMKLFRIQSAWGNLPKTWYSSKQNEHWA